MTSDVPTLIAAYRAAAFEHGAATDAGDHRKANRHHGVIAGIYRELRNRGGDACAALLPLLDDISPYVRLWTAAHALTFAPERWEPVLRRLAQAQGLVGFDAEMTLRELAAGTLSFP
jgi:hypothetical protein